MLNEEELTIFKIAFELSEVNCGCPNHGLLKRNQLKCCIFCPGGIIIYGNKCHHPGTCPIASDRPMCIGVKEILTAMGREDLCLE